MATSRPQGRHWKWAESLTRLYPGHSARFTIWLPCKMVRNRHNSSLSQRSCVLQTDPERNTLAGVLTTGTTEQRRARHCGGGRGGGGAVAGPVSLLAVAVARPHYQPRTGFKGNKNNLLSLTKWCCNKAVQQYTSGYSVVGRVKVAQPRPILCEPHRL